MRATARIFWIVGVFFLVVTIAYGLLTGYFEPLGIETVGFPAMIAMTGLAFMIAMTASLAIRKNDLVSLEDTKGLFLASHVVPVAGKDVDDDAADVINEVSAALSGDALVEMNQRSVDEKLPAKTIASDWLKDQDLD